MKKIQIIGSTGSIGTSTLDVIKQNPKNYSVDFLVANSNVELLANQAKEFSAKRVGIMDETRCNQLRELLSGTDVDIIAGESAVNQALKEPVDVTISAAVGLAGLKPTLSAMEGSKVVGLANKESIVCAGSLIMQAAKKHKVDLIPVDSEHSALFQVFERGNLANIYKLTITASGGAFRDLSREEMESVSVEQALKHPNWNMGAKVTIDCATLANKGLEFIEASKLFPISVKNIEVLVHRQSIVHGMVSYNDGSVLAQLGVPDMRSPISFALNYPKRQAYDHKNLDLVSLGQLTFERPDMERFPLLEVAIMAAGESEVAQIAFNAANEVAVEAFLNKRIRFLDIEKVVMESMRILPIVRNFDLEMVFEVDGFIRNFANNYINKIV